MRALNKPDKSPREEIFGVCKNNMRKLMDYLFVIIGLGTSSFGNAYFFYSTEIEFFIEKTSWANVYWFDYYPPYSGKLSEIFEKNVNENIQWDHGYACSSGKQKICTWVNEESWVMMKTCFYDAKQIKNA